MLTPDPRFDAPSTKTTVDSICEEGGKLGEFAQSALSTVQSAANGLAQLADPSGTKLLPKMQFVHAPKEAEFNTADWYCQQAGNALGTAAIFFGLSKLAGAGLNGAGNAAGESTMLGSAFTGIKESTVMSSALTGAAYEGILRPVGDNEGNFAVARLKHAATGAVTFGILGGAASKLGTTFRSIGVGGASEGIAGLVSGIPAGLANAEMSSLTSGHGLASADDVYKSAATFVVGGAMLGAVHAFGKTEVVNVEERPLSADQRLDQALVDLFKVPEQRHDIFAKIHGKIEASLGIRASVGSNFAATSVIEAHPGLLNSIPDLIGRGVSSSPHSAFDLIQKAADQVAQNSGELPAPGTGARAVHDFAAGQSTLPEGHVDAILGVMQGTPSGYVAEAVLQTNPGLVPTIDYLVKNGISRNATTAFKFLSTMSDEVSSRPGSGMGARTQFSLTGIAPKTEVAPAASITAPSDSACGYLSLGGSETLNHPSDLMRLYGGNDPIGSLMEHLPALRAEPGTASAGTSPGALQHLLGEIMAARDTGSSREFNGNFVIGAENNDAAFARAAETINTRRGPGSVDTVAPKAADTNHV